MFKVNKFKNTFLRSTLHHTLNIGRENVIEKMENVYIFYLFPQYTYTDGYYRLLENEKYNNVVDTNIFSKKFHKSNISSHVDFKIYDYCLFSNNIT